MSLQENASKLQYTIIRPGGLTKEGETDDAFLTDSIKASGRISRINVAKLVAKALYSDNTNNKVDYTLIKQAYVNVKFTVLVG